MGRSKYEVAIVGGGTAGLSAALQLHALRPETKMIVIDKHERPVPPTAYKVGEALAESSSHYFGHMLGLHEYLSEEHLRKMGLRWFISANGNQDISRRIEFGLIRYSPLPTYQIDRGAIENHMVELASDRGVEIRTATTVSAVEIGADDHVITLGSNGDGEEIRARWVVDATGRQALMRNQLGVGVDLPINANSSWFRTPYRLKIDEWCDDEAWKAQVPGGTRWKSTCSFVGEGYWSWVINLGSGSASVGVVTDPQFVPWERIRRYGPLKEWLGSVEPQLAAHLPDDESELLDFMKRKNFSRTCVRAFSRKRWALAGEAAVFIDPLYSTGHDTTAIGNTLMTDLIRRELDGESGREFSQRVRTHNRTLLGLVQGMIDFFPGALAMYGHPQATAAKLMWDNVTYFTVLFKLFRTEGILDTELMGSLDPVFRTLRVMNQYMQAELRRWGTDGKDRRSAGVASIHDTMFQIMVTPPRPGITREELHDDIHLSIHRLQTICAELSTRMAEAAGEPMPDLPFEVTPVTGETLIEWSDYDLRTGHPADRDAQPADGWLIR